MTVLSAIGACLLICGMRQDCCDKYASQASNNPGSTAPTIPTFPTTLHPPTPAPIAVRPTIHPPAYVTAAPANEVTYEIPAGTCGMNLEMYRTAMGRSSGRRGRGSPRIIAGRNAKDGQIPWQARVEITKPSGQQAGTNHLCGGVIISSEYIITAAHCVEQTDLIQVYAGGNVISPQLNEALFESSVIDIYKHFRYKPTNHEYDLAILHLYRPIRFNDRMQPICIPRSCATVCDVNAEGVISGWGTYSGDSQRVVPRLQTANVKIVSHAICQAGFSNAGIYHYISDIHVCAGNPKTGGDSCKGDEGGPFVCIPYRDNKYYLSGIKSVTDACGQRGLYSVYTQVCVDSVVSWIDQITGGILRPAYHQATTPYRPAPTWYPQPATTPYRPNPTRPTPATTRPTPATTRPTPAETRPTPATTRPTPPPPDPTTTEVPWPPTGIIILNPDGYTTTEWTWDFSTPEWTTPDWTTIEWTTPDWDSYEEEENKLSASIYRNHLECGKKNGDDTKTSRDFKMQYRRMLRSRRFHETAQQKVVGGIETTPHEFPWQVRIVTDGALCGGSLLNEEWVLTAAHCIDPMDFAGSESEVFIGSHYLYEPIAGEIETTAERIIIHPDYDFNTHQSDIGLIQLKDRVNFNDKIRPICLPQPDCSDEAVPMDLCRISGWGTTEEDGQPGEQLQKAKVPFISRNKCQEAYSEANKDDLISEEMACAGYESGGIDTCQGDSGGPLVCRNDTLNAYLLNGITSYGYGCARRGLYGVYTRVCKFVDWIMRTMEADGVGSRAFNQAAGRGNRVTPSSRRTRKTRPTGRVRWPSTPRQAEQHQHPFQWTTPSRPSRGSRTPKQRTPTTTRNPTPQTSRSRHPKTTASTRGTTSRTRRTRRPGWPGWTRKTRTPPTSSRTRRTRRPGWPGWTRKTRTPPPTPTPSRPSSRRPRPPRTRRTTTLPATNPTRCGRRCQQQQQQQMATLTSTGRSKGTRPTFPP